MRYNTLDGWLDWQQSLNPKTIDLGLQRVQQVFERLPIVRIAEKVITVAGTNGKGSSVAYYETWFRNQGIRVASYTSPHLLRYNERIKFDTEPATDQEICKAFDVIDRARENISLTYFEFGTLAALYLISLYQPEVAILEVGLGGRLDAVNIIDADLAHITPIGLDHQDWLGQDRDSIAYEKAGILRNKGLAVINDVDPPASLMKELERLQCRYLISARDYHYRWMDEAYIEWQNAEQKLVLKAVLPGEHQAHNLSGVLAGLCQLGYISLEQQRDISEDFRHLQCAGRLQRIHSSLPAQLWVDVGHNEDAAQALAQFFAQMNHSGRLVVLLGMLADKNPDSFVEHLATVVNEWWLVGLDCERGLSAQQLAQRIDNQVEASQLFENMDQATKHAVSSLNNQDILLVTGSFMTVEAFLSSSV